MADRYFFNDDAEVPLILVILDRSRRSRIRAATLNVEDTGLFEFVA